MSEDIHYSALKASLITRKTPLPFYFLRIHMLTSLCLEIRITGPTKSYSSYNRFHNDFITARTGAQAIMSISFPSHTFSRFASGSAAFDRGGCFFLSENNA